MLCSLWLFWRYLTGARSLALVGSVACFSMSMLFHQATGTGVAALLVPTAASLLHRSRRQQLTLAVPFLVLGSLVLALERYYYGGAYTGQETYDPLGLHLFANIAEYVGRVFLFSYIDFLFSPSGAEFWVGGILVVLLIGLAAPPKTRLWAVWTLLATIPFSVWDRPEGLFSRYYYLPSVGSSVLLALAAGHAASRIRLVRGPTAGTAFAVAVLVGGLGANVATQDRNRSAQLYDDGKYQFNKKRNVSAAIPLLERSIALYPEAPPRAYMTLVAAYNKGMRDSKAYDLARELVRRYPNDQTARQVLARARWRNSRGMMP